MESARSLADAMMPLLQADGLLNRPGGPVSGNFEQWTSLATGELRWIKSSLGHVETQIRNGLGPDEYRRREIELLDALIPIVEARLYPLLKLLEAELIGLGLEERRPYFKYFQDNAWELWREIPLVDWAAKRPHGYPGDFALMNMIYDAVPTGETLYQRLFHYWNTRHSAEGNAVRNRIAYIQEKIRSMAASGRAIKVLSVASGPAIEIQRLVLEPHGVDLSRLEIHLLDQDSKALDHSKEKILANLGAVRPRLEWINANMRDVIKEGLPSAPYDLIYSVGLFDYFPDEVVKKAGSRLYSMLREQGRLVIGNFRSGHPMQLYMQMVMDWPIYDRNEHALHRLFSTLTSELTIEMEPAQVNLFCVLSKGS
jgi:extracellular factor (EF) 3-hydroxypalmitic acid methyl ester biosynthesis protein